MLLLLACGNNSLCKWVFLIRFLIGRFKSWASQEKLNHFMFWNVFELSSHSLESDDSGHSLSPAFLDDVPLQLGLGDVEFRAERRLDQPGMAEGRWSFQTVSRILNYCYLRWVTKFSSERDYLRDLPACNNKIDIRYIAQLKVMNRVDPIKTPSEIRYLPGLKWKHGYQC